MKAVSFKMKDDILDFVIVSMACLRGEKLASYSKRAVCLFQVPSGLG